jgi:hypothetical protein
VGAGVAEFGDRETGETVFGFGNQYTGFTAAQGAGDSGGMPGPATQADFNQAARHHCDLLDIAAAGKA